MDLELTRLVQAAQDSNANSGLEYALTLSNYASIWLRSAKAHAFMIQYCNLVRQRPVGRYALAEVVKPNDPIPIVVQGVFRYNDNVDVSREDMDSLVLYVICFYQMAMMELLQLSALGAELIVVRLQHQVTEAGSNNTYFRLQFPFCKVDQEVLVILRRRVITMLQEESIFSNVTFTPNNSWEDIISENGFGPTSSSNLSSSSAGLNSGARDHGGRLRYLPLYGSMAGSQMPSCSFVDVYALITPETMQAPTLQDRFNLIAPEQHPFFKGNMGLPSPNDDFVLWLPVFLSIYYGHGRTILRGATDPAIDSGLMSPLEAIDNGDNSHMNIRNDRLAIKRQKDWDVAMRMLELLSSRRATQEFYLFDVGRVLFNLSQGRDQGLNEWTKFAQRFDVTIANPWKEWREFDQNHLSVKTLMFFARQDNPVSYKQWHAEWCADDLTEAASGRHAHVARAIYKTYMLDFVCSSISSNTWYQFQDHRWVRMEKACELSKLISDEFASIFDDHRQVLLDKKKQSDSGKRAEFEHKMNELGKLALKLADNAFKNRVIAECCNYFIDEHFNNRFDNAANVFCCQTGVIEMNKVQAFFRPGKPEDYITMVTGVAYNPNFTWESREVQAVLSWVQQLMVDPQLIECMQLYLGSIPYGGNLDKVLVIMTGPKDAGKSAFIRGLFTAWGKYAIKGENGVLYGNSRGDGPSPSLARSRGVRVVSYEELDDRLIISSAFVKKATGNDTFFARFLHENGGDIDPLQKTIFVCNVVPPFSSGEAALRERAYLLPFGSRWANDASKDPEEQMRTRVFPLDRYFNRHIPELAKALLWCQVHWYQKYAALTRGLPRPTQLVNVNEKYWREHDYYQQFKENKILTHLTPEGAKDDRFYADVDQAYTEFKAWFKQKYPTLKLPNSNVFLTGMEQHLGVPTGPNGSSTHWPGFSLLTVS